MNIYIVWNCKICNQIINDTNEKQEHIFKHLNLNPEKYMCSYCNTQFDNLDNYLKHSIYKYFEILYECSCCKQTSANIKFKTNDQ